ncbi:hypothetical protein PM082_020699 [Marasmius tenuissimus]|nr:hypothetical protein PM082_020699 [Marasmius tenuissimus]
MPHDASVGSLEIGVVASTFLFGITSTQTYLYYQLFPRDPKWTRRLVACIWLFELGHSISVIIALYDYSIQNFGNNQVDTMRLPFSIVMGFLMAEFVFVSVQGYFILHIARISRTWAFTTGCTVLMVVRSAFLLFAVVQAVLMRDLKQFRDDWKWSMITMLVIGSFADLAIPSGRVYFLLVQRSGAHKTTAAIVDKLIVYTIETGLATGFLAALILALYLALPKNFAWLAVYTCLPKMFSNALLVNLNSRVKLRAMQESTEVVEMSCSEQSGNAIRFPHRLGARVTVSTQRARTIEDGSKEIEVIASCGEESSSVRDRKESIIVM